jgi:O-antigen/teichoic acid export membrane protein
VAYKLPTLLTLVSTVFMQAWQFSAVTESDGDKKEHALFFGQVWRSFQAVMFLAGGAVIAFAKPVMRILTTREFYSAWEFIPVLALAMVFTALTTFMGTVYIVEKKSVISFITALIGALTNIVLNVILIPSSLGVQGAAIATVLSYMIVFVVRAVDARKYIGFKLYSLHIIANSIILLIQAAILIFELPYWYLFEAVCIALLLLINYKFLFGFIEKIYLSVLRGRKND